MEWIVLVCTGKDWRVVNVDAVGARCVRHGTTRKHRAASKQELFREREQLETRHEIVATGKKAREMRRGQSREEQTREVNERTAMHCAHQVLGTERLRLLFSATGCEGPTSGDEKREKRGQ